MAPPEPVRVDVVVVGAGIGGLAAALDLHRRGLPLDNLLVVEAGNRVGGRLLTDADGTDLGGAYYGPTQDHVLRLMADLGLSTTALPDDTGPALLSLDKGPRRHRFDGTVPTHNAVVRRDVEAAIREIDRVAATIDPAAPQRCLAAAALDRQSIAQWLRTVCWTETAAAVLSLHFQALHATDAWDVSALAALWFVGCAGGWRTLMHGESAKCAGGSQQLPLRAAARLGDRVRLNTAVRALRRDDAAGTITLTCADTAAFNGPAQDPNATPGAAKLPQPAEARPNESGKPSVGAGHDVTVIARRVIFAVPPPQLQRLVFDPPLPAMRAAALQQWPMGHMIKTFTYYGGQHTSDDGAGGRPPSGEGPTVPFWIAQGISGRALSDRGIAIDVYADTKPDGAMPCLMGLVSGPQATALMDLAPEQRHRMLQEHYAAIFGAPEALQSTGYKEKSWMAEPWAGGCFFAVARPGTLSKFGRCHTAPLWDGTVRFCGTETATAWMGYMDGAVATGEESARLTLASMEPAAEGPPFDVAPRPPPVSTLVPPLEEEPSSSGRPLLPLVAAAAAAVVVALVAVAKARAR